MKKYKNAFIDGYYDRNVFIYGLSVSTRERVEQMIKEFGERVQNYY